MPDISEYADYYGALRGHRKHRLMRELAFESESHETLAKRFDVTTRVIGILLEREVEAIAEIRKNIMDSVGDETAGLWVAQKANRIAEYQGDIERCNEIMTNLPPEVETRVMATKHKALRAVAEELAQLPTRADAPKVDADIVHYVIEVPNELKGALT